MKNKNTMLKFLGAALGAAAIVAVALASLSPSNENKVADAEVLVPTGDVLTLVDATSCESSLGGTWYPAGPITHDEAIVEVIAGTPVNVCDLSARTDVLTLEGQLDMGANVSLKAADKLVVAPTAAQAHTEAVRMYNNYNGLSNLVIDGTNTTDGIKGGGTGKLVDYVSVEWGGNGIGITGDEVTITNSQVSGVTFWGIYTGLTGGDYIIDNVIVSSRAAEVGAAPITAQVGLELQGSTSASIINSQFLDNQIGVKLEYNADNVIFDNNVVSDSYYSGVELLFQNGGSVSFNNNVLCGNNTFGSGTAADLKPWINASQLLPSQKTNVNKWDTEYLNTYNDVTLADLGVKNSCIIEPDNIINQEDLPVVITIEGNYTINENLDTSDLAETEAVAITINTDNATVDGQGYEITGKDTDTAIEVNGDGNTVNDVEIDGTDKGIVTHDANNFTLTDSTLKAKTSNIEAYGTNTGWFVYGNYAKDHWIKVVTPITSELISSVSGHWNSLADSKDVYDPLIARGNVLQGVPVEETKYQSMTGGIELFFDATDDLDGNGDNDYVTDISSAYKTMDDYIRYAGVDTAVSAKSFSEAVYNTVLGVDGDYELMTYDVNTEKLADVANVIASPFEMKVKVDHDTGLIGEVNARMFAGFGELAEDAKEAGDEVSDVNPFPPAKDPIHTGHLRYEALKYGADSGTVIDLLSGVSYTGYQMVYSAYGTNEGMGLKRNELLEGMTTTLDFGKYVDVYCDGVKMTDPLFDSPASFGNCYTLEITDGVETYTLEAGVHLDSREIYTADDEIMCAQNLDAADSASVSCDAILELNESTHYMDEGDNVMAHADFLENNFTEFTTVDVVANGGVLDIKINLDNAPTDGNEKMAAGISLAQYHGQPLEMANINFTSVNGMVLDSHGGSEYSLPTDPVIFKDSTLSLGGLAYNANGYSEQTIRDLGTYLEQRMWGNTMERSIGVGAFNRDFTFTNNVVNSIANSNEVTAVAKDNFAFSDIFYDGYAGAAVAGSIGDHKTTALIKDNFIDNFERIGVGVHNMETRIENNAFYMEKDTTIEGIVKNLRAGIEVYDYANADGTTSLLADNSDRDFNGNTAISVSAFDNTISNVQHLKNIVVPTTELNTTGESLKMYSDAGNRQDDNIYTIKVYGNSITANYGLGIAYAVKAMNPGYEKICEGLVTDAKDIEFCELTNYQKSTVAIFDNHGLASGIAPIQEIDDRMLDYNDGLDGFIAGGSVAYDGWIHADPEIKETVTIFGEVVEKTVNDAVITIAQNSAVDGGGIAHFGPGTVVNAYNVVNNPQFAAYAYKLNATTGYIDTISDANAYLTGDKFAGTAVYYQNKASNTGQLLNEVNLDEAALSVDGRGVLPKVALDDSLVISHDAKSMLSNIVIKENVFDSIGHDLSRITDADYTDDLFTSKIMISELSNVTLDGTATLSEFVNTDTATSQAKEDAYDESKDTGGEVGYPVDVRCTISGNAGGPVACDVATVFYAIDHACYNDYSTPDEALLACGYEDSSTGTVVDGELVTTLYVEGEVNGVGGQYNFVSINGEVGSTSHVVNVPELPEQAVVNLKVALNKAGGKVGLKSKQYKGSLLTVYEPIEVIWSSDTAYYPFVFESDSDWTVNVCLEAPEGYVIVEPEECVQTFVSGEIKTIEFIVDEIGTVNTDTEVSYQLTDPSGKKKTVKSKISNKIGKKYIEEFLAKNGGNLADAGYYLDEGRLKKLKSNNGKVYGNYAQ